MLNTTPVSPKQALQALIDLTNVPGHAGMLWGPPGIGKSSIARQLAGHLAGQSDVLRFKMTSQGLPLVDFRLTDREPTDIRGLVFPDAERGVTRWLPPEDLPRCEGPGVVLLDELSSADERVVIVAYQLLLERRVGSYHLPDGWFVLGAGNLPEHGAIARELGSAANDRLVHFNLFAVVEDTIAYGLSNDWASQVLAVLRARPDLLDRNQQRLETNSMIEASPRGWECVSDLVKGVANRDSLQLLVTGKIGEAAATEFFVALDEINASADVLALMKAGGKKRLQMMPKSVLTAQNLIYGLVSQVRDSATLGAAIEILRLIPEARYEEPVMTREMMTLGFELVAEKAIKQGLRNAILEHPEYQAYAAERRAQREGAEAAPAKGTKLAQVAA